MMRERFVTVDELPVMSTCAVLETHTGDSAIAANGTYDCEQGTWTSAVTNCCPRGATCEPSMERCLALVVSSPLVRPQGLQPWTSAVL